MTKLNQINALVTGRKGEAEKVVGDIYKIVQKPELFVGRLRIYKAHDEVNGEKLPMEGNNIQFHSKQLIKTAVEKWTELWNLTFSQDAANQRAKADIVVDGVKVLVGVPVTSLLFLEKQVNDVETFVSKLPTPDPAEEWNYDANLGTLKSKVSQTLRTKKEPTHYLKAPATEHHPAQVEFFYKDVPVGTWDTTVFSAAIPADEKRSILVRIKKLKDAIKTAREEANMIEASMVKAGEPLFEFIFGPQ